MRWIAAFGFVLVAGCGFGPTGEEAALNRRNRDLGMTAAKLPDPTAAAIGMEVAQNADTLDRTAFAGAAQVPTPQSPEQSQELRREVEAQHEVRAGMLGFFNAAVGLIPGGNATLAGLGGALTAALAFLRGRKWRGLTTATFRALDEVRDGAGIQDALKRAGVAEAALGPAADAIGTYVKERLDKEHQRSGWGTFAAKVLDGLRG